MSRYRLRLYVTGRTPTAMRAIANLREICATRPGGDVSVEVLNVVENPEAAGEERLLGTPTVVRLAPEPRSQVLGDLGDHAAVVRGLALGDPSDARTPAPRGAPAEERRRT